MTRIFLRGLAVVLPITITLYVLYWLAVTAESTLGGLLQWALPSAIYVPGLGVAAGITLVFTVGMAMRLWLARTFVALGEQLLAQLPLVKTIYGSVKDLMRFFSSDGQNKLDQVVLVSLDAGSAEVLGFVTREKLPEFSGQFADEHTVAVYIPMSYQIGGFTVLVPRSRIKPTNMSVEDALRFAMTAGVSAEKVGQQASS